MGTVVLATVMSVGSTVPSTKLAVIRPPRLQQARAGRGVIDEMRPL